MIKTFKNILRQLAIYPSRQRLMYSYYKLYKKDEKKAAECMRKLKKMIDTYSLKADAVFELETVRNIAQSNFNFK